MDSIGIQGAGGSGPALRCDIRPERERVRVLAEGELDFATVETLRRCVDDLLEVGFAHVVVDLTGLSFVDSAGFRLLIDLTERARAHGQTVTLGHPSPALDRLSELIRSDGGLVVEASAG